MDWHTGIRAAYPDALLIIQGNTLDDLVVTNQETGEPFEFDQALATAAAVIVAQEQALASAQRKRASAYTAEADPMFFKYQAGEVTKEEWLAKREEIRQRYPYPS